MGKTAFMFPGQGAQYTGMGQSFYEQYPCSRSCFETAGRAVGTDMAALIFQENDRLDQTEYTQIALYVTEYAILSAVREQGIEPDVNIGLSLGEYTAVTAGGALDFEDGCRLVQKRGRYMEQAVPDGIGGMAAVLGMTADRVEAVLLDGGFDTVCIANYNCPGQIVISGRRDSVIAAMAALKEAGAKRTVLLNVSGPFHSPLLSGAGDKLAGALETIKFHPLSVPYIANLNAEYVTDSTGIQELLRKQVSEPVRFEQSIRRLIADGADTFVEIGPGRTLTGFVKKIAKQAPDRTLRLINIEKPEDLAALK